MNNKKRHVINLKIPSYLNDELDKIKAVTWKTKNTLIREAIEKYVREYIIREKLTEPF